MPRRQKPECVLAIRLSALGDVAMALPVLYDACAANPDVRFIMLTRGHAAGIFLNPPPNLAVVGADLSGEYAGARGMLRLMGRLHREYGFDAVADLHDVLRTRVAGLWCALHGVRLARIRKGRRQKARLCRGQLPAEPIATTTERYEQVITRLGLDYERRFTSLFTPAHPARPEAFAAVTAPRAPGERWVGIAPFAAHAQKVYPPDLMEQVARQLAGRGVRVFLFGGGDYERRVLQGWVDRCPALTSLASARHGFACELTLMSQLSAMVAMDSANMHLAALAGVPTVTVWGATHPAAGFTPRNFNPDLALQEPLPCRPCSVFGSRPCRLERPMLCMESITPLAIIDAVECALRS